ncbi:uncharacterized protein LOC115775214 isoform X1 [Archocentrus centrarchus]|uniref:uncharacterized protein LOC115775214 isoform X1 n=1 Tax=Archocentrus centrarchus TaxID=63155 RepID=UPI0011EA222D|nr:uncharacterized protein LOC115775214 isoform X1 [Archocentrus centrarchus]
MPFTAFRVCYFKVLARRQCGQQLGFFSRSSKRTSVLDKVVAHRLPASSNVRWNFHSRAINTVFEHREDLIRCFQSIQDSGDFDPITVREAGAFAMLLEDQDFKFFLQLFHHIMPHVDLLYAKLQKKVIDSVCIQESIQQFQQDIQKIRSVISYWDTPGSAFLSQTTLLVPHSCRGTDLNNTTQHFLKMH